MPQVMPWYCPHTDRLFGSKDRYLAHVKAMAADRYDLRMRKKRGADARAFLAENLYKVSSLDDLSTFIKEHAYVFYLNGMLETNGYVHRDPSWRGRLSKTFAFTEVKFRVREGDHHRVRDADEFGLSGELVFHYEFDAGTDYPMNPFVNTRLLTGSGSGTSIAENGTGRMRYDVALLARDWPALFVGERLLA